MPVVRHVSVPTTTNKRPCKSKASVSSSQPYSSAPIRVDPLHRTRGSTAAVIAEVALALNPPRLDVLKLAVLCISENLDSILDNVEIDAVRDVGHLSRDKRQYIKTYTAKRVKHGLDPWINQTQLFLDTLRTSESVVGGGVALSIALAGSWEPGSLDIFVRKGEGFFMRNYLMNNEGYHYDHVIKGHRCQNIFGFLPASSPGFVGLHSTHVLRKVLLVGGRAITRWLRVYESADAHCLTPIFYSHATWSMTWITSDSIVVAYPELTFYSNGMASSVYHSVFESNSEDYLDKWWDRGFDIVSKVQSDMSGRPCRAVCPTLTRSTDDKYVFRMPFDRENDVMPTRQWLLKARRTGETCANWDCPHYGFSTVVVNSSSV